MCNTTNYNNDNINENFILYFATSKNSPKTDYVDLRDKTRNLKDNFINFYKKEKSKYATFNPKIGIDITLGNKNISLGILIRGIFDIKNNILISEPIKVLNEIYGENNKFIQNSKNYKNYIEHSKKIEKYKILKKMIICILKKK